MNTQLTIMREILRKRQEEGFTLLEYAAGAALLMGIIIGVMSLLDQGFTDFFTGLQGWLSGQGTSLGGSGSN